MNNNGLYAPGPLTAQFVYDGLGRCVRRTVNGVATLIVYDGWKPIAEWYKDKPEYFERWNVYGPGADELLLRHEGKYGYLRFQQDSHWNVMFLLDETGKLLERYTYDAFGHPSITDPAGNVRSNSWFNHCFLFQGREYIRELGIYDYRHRFYDPELGRFLQVDPKGFDAGDMNLFRYCDDDPIDRSDPLGLYNENFGSIETAIESAKEVAKTASFHQQRTRADTGGQAFHNYAQKTRSAMVPVLKVGNKWELGTVSYGVPAREGNKVYEVEQMRPQDQKRLAASVHGHNDITGLAENKWSKYDKALPRRGIIVLRMDESDQKNWYRLTPANNPKGYNERPEPDQSRVPDARTIELNPQATGVPSLAPEAVNTARGPR